MIARYNRNPKFFGHEPTKKWIMAVALFAEVANVQERASCTQSPGWVKKEREQ